MFLDESMELANKKKFVITLVSQFPNLGILIKGDFNQLII